MALIEWKPKAWQLYNDLLDKLIYYYDEPKDVVHIIDIWDTKMNPQALIRRIK